MPIHRGGDHKIDICAFGRVVDWLSQGRGTMHPALRIDTFNLLRRDERTRGIMHRNIFRLVVQAIQTSANGILPMFAACDD